MTDLERQLRDLSDTPAPVALDEVKRRQPPKARGLAVRRRSAITGGAAAVAVVAALVAIAVIFRSGGSGTTVAVGSPPPPSSPAPVAVSIVLQRTSVVAGQPIPGQIVVDNNTGRTITICPSVPFISTSVSRLNNGWYGYAPLVGGCEKTRLAAGDNRFAIRVATTATMCSMSPNQTTLAAPLCSGTGGPPPLAAGRYRVVAYVNGLPAGSRQPATVPIILRPSVSQAAPSTTLAPTVSPNAPSLQQVTSVPGPQGTTIRLATSPESPSKGGSMAGTCYLVTMSSDGAATEPGKPWSPMSGCEPNSDLNPTNLPVGELTGELWRSPGGTAYWISLGRARGATSVQFDFAVHHLRSAPVTAGWYLIALTYANYTAGYTETSFSPTGETLAVRTVTAQAS